MTFARGGITNCSNESDFDSNINTFQWPLRTLCCETPQEITAQRLFYFARTDTVTFARPMSTNRGMRTRSMQGRVSGKRATFYLSRFTELAFTVDHLSKHWMFLVTTMCDQDSSTLAPALT